MRAAAAIALLLGVFLEKRGRVPFSAGSSEKGTRPLFSIAAALVRTVFKHPWLTLGALAISAVLAGFIVIASGLVPVKASSGHWRITAAVLDFAKVRSVTTHSIGIRPPVPLDDLALVLRGAGHYESGCYPCHGRPGAAIPPSVAAMTPPPPELPPLIRRWRPQDLFSIVKHGIKFTGMPAWPAQQRDDEVWAMVAFLRRMPDLDAAAYRELVYGPTNPPIDDQQTPHVVREVCWRCHGLDGKGRAAGAFPSLAGQRTAYLYNSLRAFADGQRFSGIMGTIAATLDDRAMHEAAVYYEHLPSQPPRGATDASARARGEAIVMNGVPDRDIPSCSDCHGPGEAPKNAAYPVLAGQDSRYLALQLELFQRRQRGGSGYANLMHVFVDRLQPAQIGDVAQYYGSLLEER